MAASSNTFLEGLTQAPAAQRMSTATGKRQREQDSLRHALKGSDVTRDECIDFIVRTLSDRYVRQALLPAQDDPPAVAQSAPAAPPGPPLFNGKTLQELTMLLRQSERVGKSAQDQHDGVRLGLRMFDQTASGGLRAGKVIGLPSTNPDDGTASSFVVQWAKEAIVKRTLEGSYDLRSVRYTGAAEELTLDALKRLHWDKPPAPLTPSTAIVPSWTAHLLKAQIDQLESQDAAGVMQAGIGTMLCLQLTEPVSVALSEMRSLVEHYWGSSATYIHLMRCDHGGIVLATHVQSGAALLSIEVARDATRLYTRSAAAAGDAYGDHVHQHWRFPLYRWEDRRKLTRQAGAFLTLTRSEDRDEHYEMRESLVVVRKPEVACLYAVAQLAHRKGLGVDVAQKIAAAMLSREAFLEPDFYHHHGFGSGVSSAPLALPGDATRVCSPGAQPTPYFQGEPLTMQLPLPLLKALAARLDALHEDARRYGSLELEVGPASALLPAADSDDGTFAVRLSCGIPATSDYLAIGMSYRFSMRLTASAEDDDSSISSRSSQPRLHWPDEWEPERRAFVAHTKEPDDDWYGPHCLLRLLHKSATGPTSKQGIELHVYPPMGQQTSARLLVCKQLQNGLCMRSVSEMQFHWQS